MVLNIVAVGKEIDTAKLNEATKRLAFYDLEDYRLNLIQGPRATVCYNSRTSCNKPTPARHSTSSARPNL